MKFFLYFVLIIAVLEGLLACSHSPIKEGRTPASQRFSAEFINPIELCARTKPIDECHRFLMGSKPEESLLTKDDERLHSVILSDAFEIQSTPVTQSQYVSVMNHNPSYFKLAQHCPNEYVDNPNPDLCMCPHHPVEQVTWREIEDFIGHLNREDGTYQYRLPTEAEWEYAARGGTQTAYFFGDDPKLLGDYAWYFDNANRQTQPVGTRKANPFGLYDMLGNIKQWVEDWYEYASYPADEVEDPVGPNPTYTKVARGGCWIGDARVLRSASRSYANPKFGNYDVGFRLVRTIK